ncbi:MAG: L,D-transpeptidase family protein [Pseudomonadota bacterium]
MKYFCHRVVFVVAGAAVGAALSMQGALATTPEATAGPEVPAVGSHSVLGSAIKLALALPDAASDGARAHYEASAFEGIWFGPEGDDSKALELIAALEGAGAHALPVSRYRIDMLRKAVLAASSGDPARVATAEIALTHSFLTYARDVSSGLLEPRSVDRELHVFPDRPQEAALLARLSRTSSVADFIERLAPQNDDYRALKAELATLVSGTTNWGAAVPVGPSIRFGEVGPRIDAMRARLIAIGDHQVDATISEDAAPAIYDDALEASVRAFQRRHGLNDDGIAGRRTIDAMNASPEDRRAQIIVNMERLRWMNRDLGRRHVYVNQADFTVQLIDAGTVVFSERVVVGKRRRHRTPEFSDQMTHLVLNPTWHVPNSIATDEILPKLQEDPEYLSKKNMRLVPRGGGEAPDPLLTDWSVYTANDFPYRIKQRPSGGNALGRVKFMFPNQFSIYLHDTPSKSLFKKDARAFSHGCVRVQDPLRFAKALLSVQRDDAEGYIQRVLDRRKERRVNLDEPVPVHLTYRTAWIDQSGNRQYRDDIYGRDARVLTALRAAGVMDEVGG